MNADMIAHFEQKIREAKRQDRANYFLVSVEKMIPHEKEKGWFKVVGKRLDSGEEVAVVSKKSTSGQYLPKPGGLLRADKATQVATNNPAARAYQAEYYHAYDPADLCLNAMVRANKIRTSQRDGVDFVEAKVDVIDVESAIHVCEPEGFEAALLQALKPWALQKGDLTRDAQGKPIWTKGAVAIQPVVFVRVMGSEKLQGTIYGMGLVNEPPKNANAPATVRLPTDEEILHNVRKSRDFTKLHATMGLEGFSAVGYALVPGIRINVGYGTLTGGKEGYLASPKSWEWEFRDAQPSGEPREPVRAWRGGIVHVKKSDSGRNIVVDLTPSSAHRLTLNPPLSAMEQQMISARQAGVQHSAQQPARQEAVAQPDQPAPQQTRTSSRQQPVSREQSRAEPPAFPDAPAEHPQRQQARPSAPQAQPPVDDLPPVDAYEEYAFDDSAMDVFAQDFAALEAFAGMDHQGGQSQSPEVDVDAMIAEATDRARRRSGPRMS